MNIFVIDKNPRKSARMLCDQHVVKMILESAQMLCTAHYLIDKKTKTPYKPTHQKHPCTLWVAESIGNYNWLLKHAEELCKEYTRRYNKKHKTQEIIQWCNENKPQIKKKKLTAFVQAMPEKYKDKCSIKAYQNFYKGEKLKFARWKNGKPRGFFTSQVSLLFFL